MFHTEPQHGSYLEISCGDPVLKFLMGILYRDLKFCAQIYIENLHGNLEKTSFAAILPRDMEGGLAGRKPESSNNTKYNEQHIEFCKDLLRAALTIGYAPVPDERQPRPSRDFKCRNITPTRSKQPSQCKMQT